VQRWSNKILDWSLGRDLDPNLVATVMQIESCGYQEAVSSSGALGLFQVMPFHFGADEGMNDRLDPDNNAQKGLTYLRRSYELAQGDISKALAGYNAGHLAIQWDPATWPEETQRYVRWGSGIMQDISSGLDPSPTLQAWLEAGGASLCRKAEVALNLP